MSPPWEKYGGSPAPSPWDRYEVRPAPTPPPDEPATTWRRGLGLGAQGMTDSAAGLLGLPVDMANLAMRAVGRGGQQALQSTVTGQFDAQPTTPMPTAPLGGSQTWRDVFDYVGTALPRAYDAISQGSTTPLTEPRTARIDPQNGTERFIYGGAKAAGDAGASLLGAGLLSRTAAPFTATRGVATEMAKAPATQVGLSALGGGVSETTGDPNLGLLTTLALPAGLAATRNALSGATAPFTEEGRRRLTAQLLAKTGRREPGAMADDIGRATSPLDTQTLSTSEALRNAGVAGLERGSRNDPLMVQLWADADAARNAARTGQLDTLPTALPAGDAGDLMRAGAQRNKDLIKALRERAAGPIYDAARMSGETIDVNPVVRGFDAAIEGSKGDIQAALKRARGYLFNAEGQPENTVKATQAAHEAIGRDISVAKRAGDDKTAAALLDAQKTLAFQMQKEPLFGAAQSAYREASQPLKAYDAKTAPQVAAALRRDQFNEQYLMSPEAVPGQFWKAGDTGAATLRQFISVAGNRPAAMEALQGHVVADFRKAAFTADGTFRPNEAGRWLKTHDPALSEVPAIRRAIQDVINPVMADAAAVRFSRDAGRAVGSNTAQNLMAGQVIDNMASGIPLSRVPIAGPIAKALMAKGMQTGTTADLLRDELARQLRDPALAEAALRSLANSPANAPIVNGRYLPALTAGTFGGQLRER